MARVFITGGSGFVGSAVIDELLRRNHDVTALEDRRPVDPRGGSVRIVKGSMFDAASLDEGMKGTDAVIHLVGIIMEHRRRGVSFLRMHYQGTKRVVDAAHRAGVRRYLHMSALGVRPGAVSEYHRTKFMAETYVRASELDWTIFRPSLIHGEKGEFMQMEAKWARGTAPPFLFMPYFGVTRSGKLQPVYVNDVARAFVDALDNPRTIGEIYLVAGSDQLTWRQLHDASAKAIVGRTRLKAAMPVPVAKTLAAIGIGPLLGFNRDQVIMSQEDNVADLTKFKDHFGWEPQPFEASLATYAKRL